MKWESIVQVFIIIIGLFVGIHFSKIAYQAHEKLGHADLKGHVAMNHGILDISQDTILPQIEKLTLIKDPMSGWNIHLAVNNFRFAPENASEPHRQGEGHAHLYINGNKARFYNKKSCPKLSFFLTP